MVSFALEPAGTVYSAPIPQCSGVFAESESASMALQRWHDPRRRSAPAAPRGFTAWRRCSPCSPAAATCTRRRSRPFCTPAPASGLTSSSEVHAACSPSSCVQPHANTALKRATLRWDEHRCGRHMSAGAEAPPKGGARAPHLADGGGVGHPGVYACHHARGAPPAAQAERMQPCGRFAALCLRRLAARPCPRMPSEEGRGQLRQPGRIDDSHLQASPSTRLRLLGPPRKGREVRRKRQPRVDLGRRCLAPRASTAGAPAVRACPAGQDMPPATGAARRLGDRRMDVSSMSDSPKML